MNIAANMLGLSNAATPLGLRAMKDLESLNRVPGTASNAMCTFLAINTASVQLVSITAVAVLAAAGSTQPTAIIGTAFLATLCAATAAIASVKFFEKLPVFRVRQEGEAPMVARESSASSPGASEKVEPAVSVEPAPMPEWGKLVVGLFVVVFAGFFVKLAFFTPSESGAGPVVRSVQAISLLAIPFLLSFFPLYAALRGIRVYEEFVEGAKEGFNVALRIIPFLVAMLVAIGMFRGSGGVDLLTAVLRPVLDLVQFPPELVPMALMRPLSGSASLAIFSDIVGKFGPDSLLARMAGTVYGSTETTFYVLAVYFGSVGIKRTRHAVPAGLIADATGIIASVIVCRLVFA
jgi:spore maturation protein SpmB